MCHNHPTCCVPLTQVIADRALLARLVLLREELRALHQRASSDEFMQNMDDVESASSDSRGGASSISTEASSSSSNTGSLDARAAVFEFHRSNIPRTCAAFLKEMLHVNEPFRRLALLTKVGIVCFIASTNGVVKLLKYAYACLPTVWHWW